MRDKVRALPGSLTYLDLIRKNKRDSVLLIAAMFVLSALVGGAIGGAIIPLFAGFDSAGSTMVSYADTLSQDPMNADFDGMAADAMQAPSRILGVDAGVFRDTGRATLFALIGAAVMTLVTLGLALEAWFGGGRFLLNRVHAKEITKELDPELFNVVDEMRIAAGIPMPRVYLIPESALNAFATAATRSTASSPSPRDSAPSSRATSSRASWPTRSPTSATTTFASPCLWP